MSTTIATFRDLKTIPGLHEIVWIGAMMDNNLAANNPLVMAILKNLATNRLTRAVLPLGSLVAYHSGDIVDKGEIIRREFEPVTEQVFVDSSSFEHFTMEGFRGNPGRWRYWQESINFDHCWPVVKDDNIFLIRATDAQSQPLYLVVPHAVLAPAYFGGGSSETLPKVFCDGPGAFLRAFKIRVEGRVITIGRMVGSKDDRMLAVRLACNTATRRAALKIRTNLRIAARSGLRFRPINMGIPFDGKAFWAISSRPLPDYDGVRCVLVTRIISCAEDYGIERIQTIKPKRKKSLRKNAPLRVASANNTSNSDNPDDQPRPVNEPADNVELVNHVVPNRGGAIRQYYALTQYPNLEDLMVSIEGPPDDPSYTPNRETKTRSWSRRVLDQASMAAGSSTHSEALRKILEGCPDPLPLTEAFERLLQAGEKSKLPYTPVVIRGGKRVVATKQSCTTYFVAQLSDQNAETVAPWIYTEDKGGKVYHRRILILEYLYHSHYCYVFEIERFPWNSGDYKTLTVVVPEVDRLKEIEMTSLITQCVAVKGVWDNAKITLPNQKLIRRGILMIPGITDDKLSVINTRLQRAWDDLIA